MSAISNNTNVTHTIIDTNRKSDFSKEIDDVKSQKNTDLATLTKLDQQNQVENYNPNSIEKNKTAFLPLVATGTATATDLLIGGAVAIGGTALINKNYGTQGNDSFSKSDIKQGWIKDLIAGGNATKDQAGKLRSNYRDGRQDGLYDNANQNDVDGYINSDDPTDIAFGKGLQSGINEREEINKKKSSK